MRAFLLAALAAPGVASECSLKSLLGPPPSGQDLDQIRLAVFKDECRPESSVDSAAKRPDPRQTQLTEAAADRLLNETRQHAAAGHCSDALRSITAYHYGARNAVGHGGVRLSYAIDDWYELGRKYPPAMDALLRARDEAAAAVLDDTYCGDDSAAFAAQAKAAFPDEDFAAAMDQALLGQFPPQDP